MHLHSRNLNVMNLSQKIRNVHHRNKENVVDLGKLMENGSEKRFAGKFWPMTR